MHNLCQDECPPAEDLAISSLLEIDLKESADQQTWTDHKKLAHLGTKTKAASINRLQHTKNKPTFKHHSKRYEDEPSLRSHYNPQMMDANDVQPTPSDEPREEERESKQREESEKKFNEGEYWSSKVNWMTNGIKQQMRSQPKLSKKFSFGYETNTRQSWRGSNRYDSDEKTRHQEYKTNLIYSILSGEAETVRLKQLEERNKLTYNRSCQSTPTKISGRQQNRNLNKQTGDNNCNLTKNIQESMRKTLKKISARGFQDGSIQLKSPNNKQSEFQRAALVRLMLQNIETAKERLPVQHKHQKPKLQQKHQQIMQDIMQPFIDQIKQIKRKSNVVNLNLQAEKIYKGRIVNKWNGRRLIQVVKVQ